jgi:EmrB/QacA subfamily drug resistance transporter
MSANGENWAAPGTSTGSAGWEGAAGPGGPAAEVPNRLTILAVVLVGAFMILLDATIVNVAVPTIQRSLHASYGAIEWVVSGYALSYGLLLIPAGRLGDRIGHKKVYLIGLAGFTVASVLCGTSATVQELVAWRIVQGAMAGVMNPPVLAVIQAVFPAREMGKAFGWYGAVAGLATALGPLAGGLLIAWNLGGWDWRPVFLVNLPIGVLGLVAALRLVPESRGTPAPLDLAGAALVCAAMILLTYPLIEGQGAGWAPWTFACIASALPVLAAFVVWERSVARRGSVPLVNLALYASRSFAAGSVLSLVYFAGFIGLLFVLSLYLQIGLDWSPLHAGLAILPFAAGTFLGAVMSDGLARRLGRGVLQIGSVAVTLATVALILVIHAQGPAVTGWQLLAPLLIGGIGSGMVIAPNVEVVLSGVSWQDAGSAGGMLNTSQRLGQAIGIAVVGVAFFGSLSTGAASGQGTRRALAESFTHATVVASLYALGAMVLTVLLVPFLPGRRQDEEWAR